jgi:hypothetical protein
MILEKFMSAGLSNRELEIVTALKKTGFSLPGSTVAVVMATREHARPGRELADILRQYQNLESSEAIDAGVNELLSIGWLAESESYGLRLTHQSPHLREFVEAKLGWPGLAREMQEMRSYLQPGIKVVGPMNDISTYQTYLDLLQGAQSEICLPMLATTPNLSSVRIIRERALSGVKVRILLGSRKLTARLRGTTMARTAADSIHGWHRNAEGCRKIDIRVSKSAMDMEIASCMLIDGRLLRFDIYDPARQRSLEGVMVEVSAPTGLDTNLISVFKREFERGWSNARPLSVLGALGWYLRSGWRWFCFASFLIIVFVCAWFGKNNWAGIFGSVSATFFVDAFISSFQSIRSWFTNLHAR